MLSHSPHALLPNKQTPMLQPLHKENNHQARLQLPQHLLQPSAQQKLQNKTLTLARKNADFWVLQNGIGGLGLAYQGLEPQHMPEPLRMFSGTALLEALTGIQLSIAGTKHPRDISADEDPERRVRTRSNSHELGRAADSDDFETGFVDDTIANTIEQGRDAASPLPDVHSSAHALPWNHAAPASRGSSHHTAFIPPYPVFGPGAVASSSVAGGGGFSIANRRTVSASPLVGRGTAVITAEDADLLHSDTHFANAFAASSPAAAPHPSFDLFGPAAFVSTQLASTTPFLTATLTTESLNFLAFVKAGIAELQSSKETTIEAIASVLDVEQEATEVEETVEFEVLLAPETNSRVVAAQGFLHVLSLVTRGLLAAEQERAFGGIELRVL
jgi:meiotic recombination protein REC8